ncbi:MAG: ATP-dependent zinc metalloprotease FtsH [Chloroflexota bacterium]
MFHDRLVPGWPLLSTFKKSEPRGGSERPAPPEKPEPTESPRPPDGTQPGPLRDKLGEASIWWGGFLVALALAWLVGALWFPVQQPRVEVSYTFFKQQVVADNVVSVSARDDTLQGTFRQEVKYPPEAGDKGRPVTTFSTVLPAFADPTLGALLDAHGVTVTAASTAAAHDPVLALLLTFGPAVLLFGGMFWLFRRTSGAGGSGIFGMGKSQARRYDVTAPGLNKVTFADVAGIDEAEQELIEIVDFLKDPTKYTRLGGSAPRGVLLVGAPGTGKTLLAKAVAGEAGVPFLSMGASEFVEMFVGVGASRVRDLFKQAREIAPAIVFVDELDAVGRSRGRSSYTGGNSEQEQTLNQILTEMDGFSSQDTVIVLAATNRPDMLDPALLRAGRFDRRIVVQAPDKAGREAILRVHTRQMPLDPDVSLKAIAEATPGLVGADLRNLANEAALLAARRAQETVHERDFLDALEKILLGPARPLLMTPDERERVAYHEGGHTILGLLVPGADPVKRVTIVPHGMALGVTYQRPPDDRHNHDERYLRARVIGAMGGRAAESLVYGSRTTGSENDMQQATEIVRQMVTRWGMSDKVGPVVLAPRSNPFLSGASGDGGLELGRPYSEETATLIDAEIHRTLQEAYDEAVRVLAEHRQELDALAQALLEHETLEEDEILAATGLAGAPVSLPPAAVRPPVRQSLSA